MWLIRPSPWTSPSCGTRSFLTKTAIARRTCVWLRLVGYEMRPPPVCCCKINIALRVHPRPTAPLPSHPSPRRDPLSFSLFFPLAARNRKHRERRLKTRIPDKDCETVIKKEVITPTPFLNSCIEKKGEIFLLRRISPRVVAHFTKQISRNIETRHETVG